MRFIIIAALVLVGGKQDDPVLKQGPKPLSNPGDWGIGARVDDLSFTDASGRKTTLAGLLKGNKLLVILFDAPDCPVSKLYRPKTRRFIKLNAALGIQSLVVYCNFGDKPDADAFPCPVVHDKDGRIGAALKADRTTDAFVIDADRTLRYRGAIDDQYGIGYKNEEAKKTYLLDAVTAVLDGKKPAQPATRAPG